MTDEPLAERFLGPSLPSHLYVHVPFCASKCAYCDFASVSGASDDTVRTVFRGIRTQIRRWAMTGLPGVLETVYVGGGTPSRYPEEVVRVLDFAREHLPIRDGAEVTVEANPDSFGEDVAETFADAGVTRVSVGVQSFDDTVLRTLGRRHDARTAWDACSAVAGAGLKLSLDLICGVPGQSMTSWSETIGRAACTGAVHMSVYPLSVEVGTPLSVAVDAGLVAEPDPDIAAEMMVLAEESLGRHDFERYEVANYASERAFESRHNTAYWSGRAYIGVGPGAHGMLDAETARMVGLLGSEDLEVARVRYANCPDIDAWLVGRGDTSESLTAAEAAREDVMLGMRLVRGVPVAQVDSAGLGDVFEALRADGLVELAEDGTLRTQGSWRTTRRGWLLGNEVFGRIWAAE